MSLEAKMKELRALYSQASKEVQILKETLRTEIIARVLGISTKTLSRKLTTDNWTEAEMKAIDVLKECVKPIKQTLK